MMDAPLILLVDDNDEPPTIEMLRNCWQQFRRPGLG